MEKDQVKFAPFSAINDFMMPDYRLKVLHTVLGKLEQLPADRRNAINAQLKRYLKIPGFRNAQQAPASIKVKNSVSVFERNPEYAAHIVAGWTELFPELRQQVFDFLVERGWELLPQDAERTKLPGYLTRWPKSDSFEAITTAFHARYPELVVEDNDISLMTVWLSGRLPYDVVDTDNEPEEKTEQA